MPIEPILWTHGGGTPLPKPCSVTLTHILIDVAVQPASAYCQLLHLFYVGATCLCIVVQVGGTVTELNGNRVSSNLEGCYTRVTTSVGIWVHEVFPSYIANLPHNIR